MSNTNEQLVSAQMLHTAGWLSTASKEYDNGVRVWGQLTGNPTVLMTKNGLSNLPCVIFTQISDGTVTSNSSTASLKNYKVKSDITESNRLLRWKDFEKTSDSTESTDNPD